MSETQTVTLADFLLARIAEDEEAARAAALECGRAGYGDERRASGSNWGARYHKVVAWDPEPGITHLEILEGRSLSLDTAQHVARHDPARVLAECEAKRRIVADLVSFRAHLENKSDDVPLSTVLVWQGIITGLERAVGHAALAFADHPDWREGWKP